MIGFVIDGRYAGSSLNKRPDINMLLIETKDGDRIAISKENVVSIDDVTEQYSTNGRKTLMIIWNDFETSLIQFGTQFNACSSSSETIGNVEMPNTQEYVTPPTNNVAPEIYRTTSHRSFASSKSKRISSKKSMSTKVIISICLSVILLIVSVFLVSKHTNQLAEQARIAEEQERKVLAFKASLHSTIIDTMTATINREYYGDLTNKQILDTVTVTYSEESIVDGNYSGIATYRITLGNKYYYYELSLIGNIDSGTGNASLIKYYDEDSGSDTNYPTQPAFTNKYGSATTRCAYKGCNKYIATSGDTNCCTTHSNKCLNCKCYIDSDAAFCMDCIFEND